MKKSGKTTLDFKQLRKINKKRAVKWNKGVPSSLDFSMMELAGECGEACNAAKKLSRLQKGWVGGLDTTENLIEELADVVICVDLIAMQMDIDLSKAVASKFNATSKKFGFEKRL